MINTNYSKTILKENKIHFYSYWDKKLIDLAKKKWIVTGGNV